MEGTCRGQGFALLHARWRFDRPESEAGSFEFQIKDNGCEGCRGQGFPIIEPELDASRSSKKASA